jgi:uncharacterized protein (DUF2267 family)
MEFKEFIQRVQEETGLTSPDEATAAVEAVLGTLGEMLAPTERRHLIAQLHKPMKDYVSRWVARPPKEMAGPHRFPLEEFYHRVAARSGVRYPAAVHHTQAVMKVLRDAVPIGELADVFRDLPREYDELLTGVPATPGSPSIVE